LPALPGGPNPYLVILFRCYSDPQHGVEVVAGLQQQVPHPDQVFIRRGLILWIMEVTASAHMRLKAQAGVKLTGRRLEKPVFPYSILWPPHEQPAKEEQIEAAHDSLKVLGLEEHQAIIFCHNDAQQARVHVLVNRVDPWTGKANTLFKCMRKLSRWAWDYLDPRIEVIRNQPATLIPKNQERGLAGKW
jgi:hypothetical protein